MAFSAPSAARGRPTRRAVALGAAAALLAALAGPPARADAAGTPLGDPHVRVLLFVDQARTYGYQTMMARIQLDAVWAELARDAALLERSRRLRERDAIPLIELEIAQLKDAWNRRQLVVAEKSLAYVAAEYEAMIEMARNFAGEPMSVETLYATFRRGWEAGCDKGPDEVVAMKAWVDYLEKSVERARQLSSRGDLSLGTLLEREAQLEIARSNHRHREAGLEKCRAVLFPSLNDILAVGR